MIDNTFELEMKLLLDNFLSVLPKEVFEDALRQYSNKWASTFTMSDNPERNYEKLLQIFNTGQKILKLLKRLIIPNEYKEDINDIIEEIGQAYGEKLIKKPIQKKVKDNLDETIKEYDGRQTDFMPFKRNDLIVYRTKISPLDKTIEEEKDEDLVKLKEYLETLPINIIKNALESYNHNRALLKDEEKLISQNNKKAIFAKLASKFELSNDINDNYKRLKQLFFIDNNEMFGLLQRIEHYKKLSNYNDIDKTKEMPRRLQKKPQLPEDYEVEEMKNYFKSLRGQEDDKPPKYINEILFRRRGTDRDEEREKKRLNEEMIKEYKKLGSVPKYEEYKEPPEYNREHELDRCRMLFNKYQINNLDDFNDFVKANNPDNFKSEAKKKKVRKILDEMNGCLVKLDMFDDMYSDMPEMKTVAIKEAQDKAREQSRSIPELLPVPELITPRKRNIGFSDESKTERKEREMKVKEEDFKFLDTKEEERMMQSIKDLQAQISEGQEILTSFNDTLNKKKTLTQEMQYMTPEEKKEMRDEMKYETPNIKQSYLDIKEERRKTGPKKKMTLAELKAECRAKGQVYDRLLGRCRDKKRGGANKKPKAPKPPKVPKLIKVKPYCGLSQYMPANRRRIGSMKECLDMKKVNYWGEKVIDSRLLNSLKQVKEDKITLQVKSAGLQGRLARLKREIGLATTNEQKIKLTADFDKTRKELLAIADKIKKL